jgi:hypothetical protein
MKRIMTTAIVLCATGFATTAASACGYYAVFQCAKRGALSGPGYTIATSNVDGFRPGFLCKVLGPFNTQSKAKAAGRAGKSYVKYGCMLEGE